MYLCYHHNDMDGKAAGEQIYQFLKAKKHIEPTRDMFIMRGYDDPFNEDDYNDKEVFIVDLSFTKESIKKLYTICEGANRVTWLDHHKTSIECIENEDIRKRLGKYSNLTYFVNDGACGALLSYIYANSDVIGTMPNHKSIDYEIEISNLQIIVNSPDGDCNRINIPVWMKYIDSWDRWVYGDELDPVYFHYGSDNRNTNIFAYFESEDTVRYNDRFWAVIRNTNGVTDIINEGKICKHYFDTKSRKEVSSNAYECTIKGYKALVLNSTAGSSAVFGDKIKDYDLVCVWNYSGKHKLFKYSFYTDKDNVDCAKLANEFNKEGGGHQKAAGFSHKDLLFKAN